LNQGLNNKPAQTTLRAFINQNRDFKSDLLACRTIIEEEHARYINQQQRIINNEDERLAR